MSRVSTNLVVMPAGPALVRELAPRDTAGQRMVAELRSLVDATGDRPVHLVGSRSPRWETGVEGSFRAWGAPQVQVGAGHHLPELVQRYMLGERATRVTEVRADLGQPDPEALTLVALDGSAGLTERAPLALLPQAAAADTWCRTGGVSCPERHPGTGAVARRRPGPRRAGWWTRTSDMGGKVRGGMADLTPVAVVGPGLR